ncbi:unnamed protein product [Rotaria sp. Silwood2]|nr:unnamed protein product [Rotaria sp. Silwood2]CAF3535687.1 unnamed protein product [Rotaria sp. Silwood2]CAF4638902.1 unnamed protein product [Rotaria sp. Silwood2]CAF4796153.1 unnamed protein product [Rotaria sp. Silwood2]
MALPLISTELIDDALQLLMNNTPSTDRYNFRLLNRFGLHPSIWEFIHYLKHEEALVSHRIIHLDGGGGITSSTLLYVLMQAKSKAKENENEKQLIRLQDLYYSNCIGLKQYFTSVTLMVGKVAEKCTNANSADQAGANAHSVNNEGIVD